MYVYTYALHRCEFYLYESFSQSQSASLPMSLLYCKAGGDGQIFQLDFVPLAASVLCLSALSLFVLSMQVPRPFGAFICFFLVLYPVLDLLPREICLVKF